jgi:hypothetical protein
MKESTFLLRRGQKKEKVDFFDFSVAALPKRKKSIFRLPFTVPIAFFRLPTASTYNACFLNAV